MSTDTPVPTAEEIKRFREVVAGAPYTPKQTAVAPSINNAGGGTSFAAAQTAGPTAEKKSGSRLSSLFNAIGLDKATFDKGLIKIGLGGMSLPNPFGKEHYVVPEDPNKPQKSMLPKRDPGTTIDVMDRQPASPAPMGPGGTI